ncbi:sensor histidine kinase [Streptomyces piniterrae]|uniref:histidine kinase n=1 Tax=Streptomyces piniterrae TaxID=2571125 RepID=A0A4U0NKE1_9ACTN|nr:histidine kinase [Streptomyces piniterrae]TJZ50404.1 sensor histidine kinase [Streptomyces piniterrae]
MWPPRRIAGESLLSVVLALLAAGSGALTGGGTLQIVGIALATGVLSPLRRVLPATVLLVSVVGSDVFEGLAPLALVAAWSAGRRIAGAGRATVAFGLAYVLSLTATILQALPQFSVPLSVFAALWLLGTVIVPGLAGRYWVQRRTLLNTLREYNAQLLRERAMIAGQARLRERQRIAQDMHDSLGHQLALISVHTGALEVDRELTGRQREAVGVLREASVAAMHELREVVGLLRDGTQAPGPEAFSPATAAGVPGGPVAAAGTEDAAVPSRGVAGIEDLVAASRGAGTAVELRRSGEPRPLPPTADHAAYRIAQEGLTNAHKHSRGASITIELRYEPDSLVVEVANGPAPAPADGGRSVVSGGQGLTGLGERTRLIGGMVHAGPTADGGFRLAGVLPYTSPEGGAPGPAPWGEATPFVDPTGDFRRQIPAGPLGEGDPVIYGSGLPKELARAMSRNNRSSGIAIGCGVAALIALLLVIAAVVGLFVFVGEADKGMIEPRKYDEVKVGQSEAEVRKRLPDGSSFLTEGLEKGAPPVPQGAECLSLNSTATGSSWDREPVFRFCFKGGKLIEKKSFEVRT